MPVQRQTIVLGALTAWPFVFGVLGFLVEIFGLIPRGGSAPPPAFVIFLALLVLTPLAVLGLLVFYLVHLFTKTRLPLERKLIWAAALVAGHVFAMPLFWFRYVWQSREPAPLPETRRFALLVYGPLLLAVVLPLGYLVPFAIGITGAAILGSGPGSVPNRIVLQSWAWVFGLGLTFVAIDVAGRWCHAAFERLRFRGAVWSLMWLAFTLMLVPVGWFGTVFLRSLVPSDGPPSTLPELTRLAIVVPMLAQPGVILWLCLVARWWRGAYPGRTTSRGDTQCTKHYS
jgi:hypothetical protein